MWTKESKYGARKVTVDGFKFDSKREAARYGELCLLEKAGKITNLQRQVKFVLIPTQYAIVDDGKGNAKRKCIEKECSYVADFVYIMDGKKVVEDAKGFKTRDYRIKRKMMLWFHGIQIKEV